MNRTRGILAALLFALAGAAEASPGGADIKAALLRCADVTFPATLSGCGNDPLTSGRIEIKKGDVAATVVGATASATYDVILHALSSATNPSAQLPIGVLATDATGSGSFRWSSIFGVDQAGVVALTLSRNGSTQFVAGFRPGGGELKAGLVPCGAVNTPSALNSCGSDTLKSGEVEIDDDELEVEIKGAAPGTNYAVMFRPLQGADVPLGTLPIDNKGKGSLEFDLPSGVGGAGNVVLQRDGADQFVTGFAATREGGALVARFQVGLLRCVDVNTVAPLVDCGFDQLRKGAVSIDDKGDVKVHVAGAVAHATYEVFFVGADGTTETSLGSFTTNPAGNGSVVIRDAFPAGTRGVGQVLLKRDGIDQFVTGFSSSR